MRKIALLCFIGLSFLCNVSLAANPQTVKLCLEVIDNISPHAFIASFVSTDVFDLGSQTGRLHNGQSCVNHTYQHGPKNLKFQVKITDFKAAKEVLFLPDSSCAYLRQVGSSYFVSDVQRDLAPFQYRMIYLTQLPPMNGYPYAYYMHCEYAVR